MSETPERITLYYREGSSDKVYQANLEPQGKSFTVTFAYGRRGSTLKTGTKTPAPVDYAAAKKIYDQLVKEKMAKGYTPGEDGTPYQGTTREFRATGILPQLLNPIDEAEAQLLIADPDWWMQEKLDGKRVLLLKSGDTITGINRKGLAIALPKARIGNLRARIFWLGLMFLLYILIQALNPAWEYVTDGRSWWLRGVAE